MRTTLLLFIAITLLACSKNEKLELALKLADNNRPELQKVLDHYKFTDNNQLKYKAAVYLIENMPGHYSYDSILMKEYHNKAIHIHAIHNDFESRRKALLNLSDRTTYARNEEIVKLLNIEKETPPFLNNIFIKDVTSKYFNTLNIVVQDRFKHTKESKYGYLSVYNNSNWELVAYGRKSIKA